MESQDLGILQKRLKRQDDVLIQEKGGTPGRIRTCDLRIRSPLLYPAELQAHKGWFKKPDRCITYVGIHVHTNPCQRELSRSYTYTTGDC
jgi:hypothetical protein